MKGNRSPVHESILMPSAVRAASAWDMPRPLTPPTHVPFVAAGQTRASIHTCCAVRLQKPVADEEWDIKKGKA
ncbi:hypothetical protein DPEC_G00237650 [Dallia pectoralis]|uniref:Uncharacterized protein n=2 Tax=Dallia pectoralis TaxID=75939 RepID=A0ACC2FZ33_DALPE|nr:hypothetical protein DPEC_G00378460 [Dallia pectoralis]KAJ7996483.1 hypothetical protein DPEC_G00237530 [Dallia pectoralis]KAJ7996495.1 hypothetical protein DPEC_G00237650 [Dallia pectoralis]